MIPPGGDPHQSSYQIGDEVQTTERGRTGTVLAIEYHGDGNRYLLDCHPGALGHYVWIRLPDGKGVYAANWLHESQIEGLVDDSSRSTPT